MGQGGADFFVHIRQFGGSEKYSLQNQINIADGVNEFSYYTSRRTISQVNSNALSKLCGFLFLSPFHVPQVLLLFILALTNGWTKPDPFHFTFASLLLPLKEMFPFGLFLPKEVEAKRATGFRNLLGAWDSPFPPPLFGFFFPLQQRSETRDVNFSRRSALV